MVWFSCYTLAPFRRQFERFHPEEGALSPILVRPVREQLEHDRVIRLLQPRYKRRFTVGINPGIEQTFPVGTAPDAPVSRPGADVAGDGQEAGGRRRGRDRRVGESARGDGPVGAASAACRWSSSSTCPSGVAPVARRLCGDHGIGVTEIWTYHTVGDQVRFAQVHRAPLAEKLAAARAAAAEARRASAREDGAAESAGGQGEGPAASARRRSPPRKPRAKRRRGEARRQSRAQTRGGQEAVRRPRRSGQRLN